MRKALQLTLCLTLTITTQAFSIKPKKQPKHRGSYIIVEPSVPFPAYLPQLDWCSTENTMHIRNQRHLALCLLKA